MINELLNKASDLIRQSLAKESELETVEVDDSTVDAALDYFERCNDHQTIKDSMIIRFATGIDKLDGEAGYEVYTKKRTAEMIESGEIEVLTSGLGAQIAGKTANLFSMQTQSWSYVDQNGEDSEEAAEIISAHRENGGFETEIGNADFIASAVDSGPLLITYSSSGLKYQAFSPTCLYAKYHDNIMDEGQWRGVDYSDLEDATMVVVRLSGSGGSIESSQYLAIFGRSDEYPQGRYVTYDAIQWDDVPPVGDPMANDWVTTGGEIANPLSWLANQSKGYVPEYPIVIIGGGVSMSQETFVPTTTSMYQTTIEIDIGMSRILKDVLNAARGKDVITNESGAPLPRSLEATVVLQTGQLLEVTGRPALHSAQAMNVLKDQASLVADGYSVPGFTVVRGGTSTEESGEALKVRMQPLLDRRDRRIKLNKSRVQKMYRIEVGLLEVHSEKKISPTVEQVWNPGRYIIPESPIDKTNNLKAAMDAKFIDYVRAVRDYHNFPTDKDAEEFIQMMQDREAEFPAPRGRVQGVPVGLSNV